jgi:hypothetical protein
VCSKGCHFLLRCFYLRRKNRGADSKEFSFTVKHLHLYVEFFNALLEEGKKKRKVDARRDKTFIPVGSTKHFPLTTVGVGKK